ncbi:MAG: hypothetical protein F6K26_51295 [Moorea sp. SIO2I5]|nr:hypothetical protein [Moorena sp. SIO2I5]
MRYTGFFPSSDFPLLSDLLPAPCSLLPKTQKFVTYPIANCYKPTIIP